MPRVLLLLAAAAIALGAAPATLSIDRGAVGAWQKILKLQTTASLLHITAHPDDEQGGLLTWASRGQGVRTGLLTLNRGEAGDNAIGPELFDALGLIRTDELLRAGEYYGLDAQYFTLVADYGYSKRLDEALEQWDRDALIGDMVRAIRTFRPLVVVSRWQGSERDGHGQHQAAGALTLPAVAAASRLVQLSGDRLRYPEQALDGLPWFVPRLYLGGAREDEAWDLRVDAGAYDPVLGDSYRNIARYGLSLQRSQTSGRFVPSVGSDPLYYTRVVPVGETAARHESLFEGLDTSIPGMYRLVRAPAPPGAEEQLEAIAREAAAAKDAFRMTDPAAAAPALVRGLAATRRARTGLEHPDVRFLLDVKVRQFEEALCAALDVTLTAIAEPPGTEAPSGPFAAFAPPATLDPVTPGEAFDVRLAFASRGGAVTVRGAEITGPSGVRVPVSGFSPRAATPNSPVVARVAMRVPADADPTRPYFARDSLAQSRYDVVNPAGVLRPFAPAAFIARVEYAVEGEPVSMSIPVMRREANLPYGYGLRQLEILPAIALSVSPRVLLAPTGGKAHTRAVELDATAYAADGASGRLWLEAPAGWQVQPASQPFRLKEAGAQTSTSFRVTIPEGVTGQHRLAAVAETAGRTYQNSYQVIRHRDLPLRYLVREAAAMVAAFDVQVKPGRHVGYVMGVGDELPAALTALGAEVTLLGAADLAGGDLGRFDTIMTGTRAYAVRDDLRTHNARLLDWVEDGGHLIVLYNTPEFVPDDFAPYPGELPRNAEEIAEQDAAVQILEPDHSFFTTPNRIGPADFEGWIEQRGSKFFTSWDDRYTALVSSHDRGQPPQRGGWLTTSYGKGRWTYMAYALHRQVPFGVPGAYRILANLISVGEH